LIYISGSNRL